MFNFRNYQSMNHITTSEEGGQLWLGDMGAASDTNLLKQKKIKHVLTAAAMLGISYPKQMDITHKIINALDLPTYKMTPHFNQAHQFIKQGLKNGNVLVHCAAGISRSTTCVLVYLMRTKGYSFKEALEFTRAKRPIINPNYGFQNELGRYQMHLKKEKLSKGQKLYKSTVGTKNSIEQDKKVVAEFINNQSNNKRNNNILNSTVGGVKDTKLLQRPQQQLINLRGKSQNYRGTFQGALKPQNRLHNHFLTFKLQAPKIVTIKR